MFDILAIDWGSERFGLAFGSNSNRIVLACNYDCDTKEIWEILAREIEVRKIKMIIVGMPTTFDLKKTKVSLQIEEFIKELQQKFGIEIIIVNERNSTKKALLKNSKLKTYNLNHQAAAEILESYFGE